MVMVIIFCLISIAKTAVALQPWPRMPRSPILEQYKDNKNRENQREQNKQVKGNLKIEWLKCVQVTLVQ